MRNSDIVMICLMVLMCMYSYLEMVAINVESCITLVLLFYENCNLVDMVWYRSKSWDENYVMILSGALWIMLVVMERG